MTSPESRHTTLRNLIRVGAVAMVVAAASNVRSREDSPVSARIEEKHALPVFRT